MRIALIITLGACYYLGWLPASFVVPSLLVFSVVRLPTGNGRTRRRGGYMAVSPHASGNANPGTVQRVQTYTASSPTSGLPSEVRAAFTPPRVLSKTRAPGDSTAFTAWGRGDLTTAADRRRDIMTPADASQAWLRAAGDCGCGDNAA